MHGQPFEACVGTGRGGSVDVGTAASAVLDQQCGSLHTRDGFQRWAVTHVYLADHKQQHRQRGGVDQRTVCVDVALNRPAMSKV